MDSNAEAAAEKCWNRFMKRVVTKIGEVYAAPLETGKKYFQYIAKDPSQLNSQVIRAFKELHAIDARPDVNQIVRGTVDFHVHVMIGLGVKLNLWEKAGKVGFSERPDVLFRNTNDYGRPDVKVSYNWHVWKIGEKFRRVGELRGEERRAEIGIVVNPYDVVNRMQTGEYSFVYPAYA
jgi:hypothetical protein